MPNIFFSSTGNDSHAQTLINMSNMSNGFGRRREPTLRLSGRIKKEGKKMFLILALVLMVVWLGLFVGLHVTSFFIHLLLIFALVSIVMHFVGGAKSTA